MRDADPPSRHRISSTFEEWSTALHTWSPDWRPHMFHPTYRSTTYDWFNSHWSPLLVALDFATSSQNALRGSETTDTIHQIMSAVTTLVYDLPLDEFVPTLPDRDYPQDVQALFTKPTPNAQLWCKIFFSLIAYVEELCATWRDVGAPQPLQPSLHQVPDRDPVSPSLPDRHMAPLTVPVRPPPTPPRSPPREPRPLDMSHDSIHYLVTSITSEITSQFASMSHSRDAAFGDNIAALGDTLRDSILTGFREQNLSMSRQSHDAQAAGGMGVVSTHQVRFGKCIHILLPYILDTIVDFTTAADGTPVLGTSTTVSDLQTYFLSRSELNTLFMTKLPQDQLIRLLLLELGPHFSHKRPLTLTAFWKTPIDTELKFLLAVKNFTLHLDLLFLPAFGFMLYHYASEMLAWAHLHIQGFLLPTATFPTPSIESYISYFGEALMWFVEVLATHPPDDLDVDASIRATVTFDPNTSFMQRFAKELQVAAQAANVMSVPLPRQSPAPPRSPSRRSQTLPPQPPQHGGLPPLPHGTSRADIPCFSWAVGRGMCASAAPHSVCRGSASGGTARPHHWHALHTTAFQEALRSYILGRYPHFGSPSPS